MTVGESATDMTTADTTTHVATTKAAAHVAAAEAATHMTVAEAAAHVAAAPPESAGGRKRECRCKNCDESELLVHDVHPSIRGCRPNSHLGARWPVGAGITRC
jgi:hypothetical protein